MNYLLALTCILFFAAPDDGFDLIHDATDVVAAETAAQITALELRIAELELQIANHVCGPPPPPPADNALLLFHDTLTPAVRDEAVAAGAEVCRIFYHWQVDPEKDGTVNLDRFAVHLDAMDPEVKWGCIDLEKPYSAWLMGNDDAKRAQAIAEMNKALALAEEKRPDVAWSFWGIPKLKRGRLSGGTLYPWTVAPQWWWDYETAKIAKCSDLYTNMEWFCPDLYWSRAAGAVNEEEADTSHIAWSAVMLAETEAVAGDRPVIPAVWHRFSNAVGMSHRNVLMTTAEWEEHLTLSLRDGVAWWAAESDKPQMEPIHRERAGEAVEIVLDCSLPDPPVVGELPFEIAEPVDPEIIEGETFSTFKVRGTLEDKVYRNCTFIGRPSPAVRPPWGFHAFGNEGETVRRVWFDNCTFDPNGDRYAVNTSGTFEDILFTGCTFLPSTEESPVRIENGNHVAFVDCNINNEGESKAAIRIIKCDPGAIIGGTVNGGIWVNMNSHPNGAYGTTHIDGVRLMCETPNAPISIWGPPLSGAEIYIRNVTSTSERHNVLVGRTSEPYTIENCKHNGSPVE